MPLDVRTYSMAEFRSLLETYSDASGNLIAEKLQSNYYEDYFSETRVKTIVVEAPYVDHDYLEDFAAYYVRCFHPYERHCARLHFFCEAFDDTDLSTCLSDPDPVRRRQLEKEYAGFLVIRPLPRSIIGRTCLVHYDSDGQRRHFPTTVPCKANLYGMRFQVDTVPFQEQDSVTAACATSALWSAFQVTGLMFQHGIPSPVEITSSATAHMPLRSRALPNADGLTIEQMAHAIRVVGLEPYYVDTEDSEITKAAVYAYVHAGVPLLIIFRLTGELQGTRREIGVHAATVTGFSIPSSATPVQFGGASLRSGRIDKLYVHDDQVGPHARMEFQGVAGNWFMSTSWGLGGQHSNIHAEPMALLFPLYNKIRLPFSEPLNDLIALDQVVKVLAAAVPALPTLEWDLRLATIAQFRDGLYDWVSLDSDEREQLQTQSLPRFLWLATGSSGAQRIVDIVFDATDIDSGRYIRVLQVHDDQLDRALAAARNLTSQLSKAIERIYDKVDTAGL